MAHHEDDVLISNLIQNLAEADAELAKLDAVYRELVQNLANTAETLQELDIEQYKWNEMLSSLEAYQKVIKEQVEQNEGAVEKAKLALVKQFASTEQTTTTLKDLKAQYQDASEILNILNDRNTKDISSSKAKLDLSSRFFHALNITPVVAFRISWLISLIVAMFLQTR